MILPKLSKKAVGYFLGYHLVQIIGALVIYFLIAQKLGLGTSSEYSASLAFVALLFLYLSAPSANSILYPQIAIVLLAIVIGLDIQQLDLAFVLGVTFLLCIGWLWKKLFLETLTLFSVSMPPSKDLLIVSREPLPEDYDISGYLKLYDFKPFVENQIQVDTHLQEIYEKLCLRYDQFKLEVERPDGYYKWYQRFLTTYFCHSNFGADTVSKIPGDYVYSVTSNATYTRTTMISEQNIMARIEITLTSTRLNARIDLSAIDFAPVVVKLLELYPTFTPAWSTALRLLLADHLWELTRESGLIIHDVKVTEFRDGVYSL